MAYGLQVYSQNGQLVVGNSDLITRLVDYFVVGTNSSGSKSYSLPGGTVLWATVKPLNGWSVHKVTFSGNTVYWNKQAYPDDTGPSGITVIAVG